MIEGILLLDFYSMILQTRSPQRQFVRLHAERHMPRSGRPVRRNQSWLAGFFRAKKQQDCWAHKKSRAAVPGKKFSVGQAETQHILVKRRGALQVCNRQRAFKHRMKGEHLARYVNRVPAPIQSPPGR